MTAQDFDIRPGEPADAATLTDLALRSKAMWGYSRAFMDACRDELTVHPHQLGPEGFPTWVAVEGEATVGYLQLEPLAEGGYEVAGLFVDPQATRGGIGRRLWERMERDMGRRGGARLVIQSEPNAAGFYEAVGCRANGSRESGSIPGRRLPLYEYVVTPPAP